MRLPLLLASSALVLAACGGTDVETAETTDTDAVVAYDTDTAALPDAGEPPLEGDSPFVGEGVTDAGVQEDSYADTNLPVQPADVRTPIGTQQAGLAGRYDVMIDGQDRPAELVIEEGLEPNTYTGTFDGQRVDIAQTDDRFTFDAPVETDGEQELMTFSGLSRDGRIEDGLIESQGDGRSMGFAATRRDDASMSGTMDTDLDATNRTDGMGDDQMLRDAGLEPDVSGTDELDDLGGTDGADDVELDGADDLGTDDPLLDQ